MDKDLSKCNHVIKKFVAVCKRIETDNKKPKTSKANKFALELSKTYSNFVRSKKKISKSFM